MTFTLRDIFGDSDECRIMEVFAENPEDVFSTTDIMRMTDVESRTVVYRHVTKLIYSGVLMLYGRDGNIEMYKLNTNNKIPKILVMLECAMSAEWLDRFMGDVDSDE